MSTERTKTAKRFGRKHANAAIANAAIAALLLSPGGSADVWLDVLIARPPANVAEAKELLPRVRKDYTFAAERCDDENFRGDWHRWEAYAKALAFIWHALHAVSRKEWRRAVRIAEAAQALDPEQREELEELKAHIESVKAGNEHVVAAFEQLSLAAQQALSGDEPSPWWLRKLQDWAQTTRDEWRAYVTSRKRANLTWSWHDWARAAEGTLPSREGHVYGPVADRNVRNALWQVHHAAQQRQRWCADDEGVKAA